KRSGLRRQQTSPGTCLILSAFIGVCAACGTTTSPSTPAPKPITITFSGLTANGVPVTSYSESGFMVSAMTGDWSALTTYGNPAPFVEFFAKEGTTVAGEMRVTASGSTFSFKSVDVYSSTTPIPYTITGFRNSTKVFTLSDTVPNTFGNFKTVMSQNASDAIDVLSIMLTNPAALCCRNPMGLDNLALAQ